MLKAEGMERETCGVTLAFLTEHIEHQSICPTILPFASASFVPFLALFICFLSFWSAEAGSSQDCSTYVYVCESYHVLRN